MGLKWVGIGWVVMMVGGVKVGEDRVGGYDGR